MRNVNLNVKFERMRASGKPLSTGQFPTLCFMGQLCRDHRSIEGLAELVGGDA